MTPYYEQSGVTLFHGDALAVLRDLPDESVHCCVTSPPYFGLRDYGTGEWTDADPSCDHKQNHGVQGLSGQRADRTFTAQSVYREKCGKCGGLRTDKQIGLERTWPEYVAKLVSAFSEVRRVLRDDGTLWLNLGDSYATGAGAVGDCPGGGEQGERWKGYRGGHDADPKSVAVGPMTQANRLPQPELKPKDLMMIPARVAIALQADGWYLRSDIIWAKPAPMPESVTDRPTRSHEHIFLLSKSERYHCDMESIAEPATNGSLTGGAYCPPGQKAHSNARPSAPRGSFNGKTEAMADTGQNAFRAVTETRNKRDVWTVNTDPFPESHFATFPPALILPCVLAGCPTGGTILDPFFGAGTTGLVAKENGRRCIGIELSEPYCAIAQRRLRQEVFNFQEVAAL